MSRVAVTNVVTLQVVDEADRCMARDGDPKKSWFDPSWVDCPHRGVRMVEELWLCEPHAAKTEAEVDDEYDDRWDTAALDEEASLP